MGGRDAGRTVRGGRLRIDAPFQKRWGGSSGYRRRALPGGGGTDTIFHARDRKLEAARARRKAAREQKALAA